MSEYNTVILARHGPVGVLTLNRPDAANTLSRELMGEGLAALDEVRADEGVRVLIVTGAGERHFCGGADLRDMADMAKGTGTLAALPSRDFMNEFSQLPQPVIAAVNGAAMGGGCEIALSCDFRIMAADAKMGLTEIAFGALPGGGGTQRLPRLVGVAKAKEMIYLGKRLTADEALACGLVNRVVAKDELMAAAESLAMELAEMEPYALAAAKYLIDAGTEIGLEAGLALERKIVFSMATPEQRTAAVERAMARNSTYQNIFAAKG